MKSISRYLLVGIWNSIFGIITFIILSRLMSKTHEVVVLALSYGISIVHAHFSQRQLVWKSKAAYFTELLKFSSAYLLQFFMNLALLLLTKSLFDLTREVRQILIALFLTLVFYTVNKRGVFRVK